MDILDKKIEEKLKLFDKIDKINSNSQTKINSLDLSDSNRLNSKNLKNKSQVMDTSSAKKTNLKKNIIDNIEKYDNIYSNFDFNKSYSSFYFRNYIDVMNYIHSMENNSTNKKYRIKDYQNNNIKNLSKSKFNIKSEFEENFLPKTDSVVERLQRYGKNIEKKKEMLREQSKENFKQNFKPEISKYAKKLKRNPEKFVERLFYNKKDFHEININKNFTFKPELNKKTIEIANKLEPSSKRLFKKKKSLNKKEIEKLAINNYKNLGINNNGKNKKISGNVRNLVNKLYNGGLDDLKKKELIYQENLLKKNEEFKNYSFQPNATNNIHKSKSIKYLNEKMYNKQIEWKNKKNMENSKKKEIIDELFLNEYCSFKPDISHEIIKDDQEMINRNIKDINIYVKKRRKQIKEKEKEKMNKSFSYNKYGFSLKDLLYEPSNELNTERITYKKCSCKNLKKTKNKVKHYRNSFDCVIPQPYTNRIFYYYNENGDLHNFKGKINHFSNVNYSQMEFINAINSLHKEIANLNI